MKIFFIFLVLMSFSIAVYGQSELEQKSRPATAGDVAGEWEMFYQKKGGLIPDNNPFIAPYQRFDFSEDGFIKNIALYKPFDEMALTIWRMAPKSSKYKFPKPGVLLIERSPKDGDLIIISIITEDMDISLRPDAPKLEKGDLALSYLTPDNKVYLQRYLKKINKNK